METDLIARRVEEEKGRLQHHPDFVDVRKMLLDSQETTRALNITTEQEYTDCAEMVRDTLKPRLKRMREFFKKFREPVNAARQVILDSEHEHCDGLAALIGECTTAMLAYRKQQQEAQRIADARAREEAEQKELERIADEADTLREGGDTEAAEELLAAPIRTVAASPSARLTPPKVKGVSIVETWRGRVDDFNRVIRWIAQDPTTRGHYVKIDQQAIDLAATAQRQALAIPGVVAVPVEGMSMRSTRKAGT
jgi:hypothetical protein